MIGFVILCTGVAAAISMTVSVVVGLLWVCGADTWLSRLAPGAQSRVLLGAALAPFVVMVLLFTGWMVDVIVLGCEAHRCLADHTRLVPGVTGMLIGGAFLTRTLLAVLRGVVSVLRSHRVQSDFADVSEKGPAGAAVIPLNEPHAFVVGMLRPRVYVSRGLVGAATRSDLRAVLAHERAHAERRDPLRRLIASLALAYHLPGIATSLERRLARANEMAADAAAAEMIGSGQRIAEVLVRFARLRVSQPAFAAASWFGGDLEARVRALLATGNSLNAPGPAALWSGILVLLVLAVAAADSIHSGGEYLLALLDR